MSEFFRTQMGRKMVDKDIPKLVNVLERNCYSVRTKK